MEISETLTEEARMILPGVGFFNWLKGMSSLGRMGALPSLKLVFTEACGSKLVAVPDAFDGFDVIIP